MDIVKILEQAKAQIKAEEQREFELAKQKVIREMAPKNQELDQIKVEELNKITANYQNTRSAIIEQHNKQLVALQEKYEAEKSTVSQAIEKKRTELSNTALSNATYEITRDCEKAIAKLENQIKEIKE
jgi:hypothetical protein